MFGFIRHITIFGFIKQIITQYSDLIVQENKFLIKDAKSALIKLSSMPEGSCYYFQKITICQQSVVLQIQTAYSLHLIFWFLQSQKKHFQFILKITAQIFKKDLSLQTDARINTVQMYCFMICTESLITINER